MNNTQDNTTGSVKNFTFTGKTGEFFSIWMVNIFLTLLTMGIYSAWAKVRTNQYFYGNTSLDNTTFRYLADPKQILKGRVIATVIFMAYYFSGLVSPMMGAVALVIIMLLLPALLVMSMAFKLRNTSYRNVKFNFNKNFKRAYFVFALPVLIIGGYIAAANVLNPQVTGNAETLPAFSILIIVAPLIIFSMFPWWEFMIVQFRVTHAKFGNTDFTFNARSLDYYKMYGMFMLYALLIVIIIAMVAVYVVQNSAAPDAASAGGKLPQVLFGPLFLAAMTAYLWVFAYIQTQRTNLLYSNIRIKGHRLKSNLKTGYMMYLYLTNTLAMALTLGLMMPWAKIRTARYRASATTLIPYGDLNEFVNAQTDKQNAIGEEIGEMFDMDLGF